MFSDIYKPKKWKELLIHSSINNRLKNISNKGDIPHLLIHGPLGSGKHTRIMCMLRTIFGSTIDKQTRTIKQFYRPSTKKSEDIPVTSSPHHLSISPSEAGPLDRHVIRSLLKEIATVVPITITTRTTRKRQSLLKNQPHFRVVILEEADFLSKPAQNSLRRMMEKYSSSTRIILVCESDSNIIEPLISRCFSIRVPSPSIKEIESVLISISNDIQIEQLSPLIIKKISIESNGNLRLAIHILQAMYVENNFKGDIPLPDWKIAINNIVKTILSQIHDPSQILLIRGMIYELLTRCIPPDIIFISLIDEIIPKLDSSIKFITIKLASKYEHSCKLGSNPIMHIEAFIVNFMVQYKKFLSGLELN